MKKYINYKIDQSKKKYNKKLLNISYFTKFQVLINLQEKALFFNKIRYKFSESFQMPEVIDMLNFRLKSSAVPATITGYIDGDEVINDFSVDDTFFKAVMVNGSWKSVGFI